MPAIFQRQVKPATHQKNTMLVAFKAALFHSSAKLSSVFSSCPPVYTERVQLHCG